MGVSSLLTDAKMLRQGAIDKKICKFIQQTLIFHRYIPYTDFHSILSVGITYKHFTKSGSARKLELSYNRNYSSEPG
jgi:hypothetical protein